MTLMVVQWMGELAVVVAAVLDFPGRLDESKRGSSDMKEKGIVRMHSEW